MVRNSIIFILIFITFGCKKKEIEPITPHRLRTYQGNATATKDGKPWSARVASGHQKKSFASLEDRFVIGFDRYVAMGDDSVLREVLNISNLQYKVYTTDLADFIYDTTRAFISANKTENAIYTLHLEDGDVVAPPCTILMSEPHWIEISAYDPLTRRVSGKFAITILSHSKDTTRYSDGIFNTWIAPAS